jgi:surfactin synthase thioesterase subunit
MALASGGVWFVRHEQRLAPRARLFCFPHAGTGASTYRLWPRALPDALEVWAVQPPGREGRLGERSATSIAALVAGLVPALLPVLDRPFAFFGHSMGAVVATEVARSLEARGGPLPHHLLVSSRRPPHLAGAEPPLHPLPDAEFVAELQRRYGGIPAEVRAQADLMALLLPSLRSDIEALETYRAPRRPPLPCPITAFGGADDPLTPREHLEAWRDETRAAFRLRLFAGGHFYLDARRPELLADVAATLAPLTRPAFEARA